MVGRSNHFHRGNEGHSFISGLVSLPNSRTCCSVPRFSFVYNLIHSWSSSWFFVLVFVPLSKGTACLRVLDWFHMKVPEWFYVTILSFGLFTIPGFLFHSFFVLLNVNICMLNCLLYLLKEFYICALLTQFVWYKMVNVYTQCSICPIGQAEPLNVQPQLLSTLGLGKTT